jgi:thiol-disulfide isomerase/thioredoxin
MENSMPTAARPLLVACLCAQWCGTCRDYAALFSQLQSRWSHVRFVWVDIEDQSDLVDPIEVENFPTILIANAEHALFFGTVTPHIETLHRLIASHSDADVRPLSATADLQALVQRLWKQPNP